MENTLTFRWGHGEINFSDVDEDDEITIMITYPENKLGIYIDSENLISLRKHIDYLLDKINSNDRVAEGNSA